jgi:hypothetical protein
VGADNTSQPFNEQAALQALEQLRGQIQDARARREQKLAEFDAFVRSNRAASHAERLAALGEPAASERAHPTLPDAPRKAERAREPAQPALEATSRTPVLSAPAAQVEPVSRSHFPLLERDPFGEAARSWRRIPPRLRAVASIVMVLVAFALSWAWRGDEGQQSGVDGPQTQASSSSGPVSTAAAGPEGAVAPAAAPTTESVVTPPPPSGALQVELTTLKPVWMRVSVDGERRMEREVPGEQKLAFGADRAIVVRVGDGGAVRLSVNGADKGALGPAGLAVTRTLTPDQ